jgi:hypothetical protein
VLEEESQGVDAGARPSGGEVEDDGLRPSGGDAAGDPRLAPLPEELPRDVERHRGPVAAVRDHDAHLELRGDGDDRALDVEHGAGSGGRGERGEGDEEPEGATGGGQT